jgi:hypothetical protein
MDSRSCTVHIYEDQASRISKWTLQYPNIETGGDIFGLWLNENEVIQAFLAKTVVELPPRFFKMNNI